GAGDDQVEFPFGGVAVKWTVLCSSVEADQFNFERRLARKLWTRRGMFEGERNMAQKPVVMAPGGFPFTPLNIVQIYFFHIGDILRYSRRSRWAGHLSQCYIFRPDLETFVLIFPYN